MAGSTSTAPLLVPTRPFRISISETMAEHLPSRSGLKWGIRFCGSFMQIHPMHGQSLLTPIVELPKPKEGDQKKSFPDFNLPKCAYNFRHRRHRMAQ